MLHHPCNTTTFKINAFCLISNEGRVKRLLLLYNWLMQPYLNLLWLLLATHFVTRTTPIDDRQQEPQNGMALVIYDLGGIHTYARVRTHTHTHTHTSMESDFKKPGARCTPGLTMMSFYACKAGKLMVEKSAKLLYFGTVSFTKHLYSTKKASVMY